MSSITLDKSVLFQLTGSNVPDSAPKEVEDQLLGGCFPILLFFFFILGSISFSIFTILSS